MTIARDKSDGDQFCGQGNPEGPGNVMPLMRRLAVALVLLLAACSSGSPRAATTTTLAPTVTTQGRPVPPFGSGTSGCRQSDLDGVALEMPAPRVVTSRVLMKGSGSYGARLDPAPRAKPRVTAANAWQRMTYGSPLRARSAELMLGRFRASIPFGPHGPQKLNLIAWVLQVHHLAYPYPPNLVKTDVCIFTDAYLVVDAATGNRIFNDYGTGA